MTKFPLLLMLAAPSLLLASCAGTQNRGLESVHQPVVSRQSYLLDLPIVGGRLAAGESQRLAGWLDRMQLSYGDHVALDDPAGDAAPARNQIATIVASYGLLLSDDVPATTAELIPGMVRVVVNRMRAAVPGCPDWTRNSSRDLNENTSSDYGCAVNSNLAAMVASPADLVRGQGVGTNDPAMNYRAIEAYRKATPTGAGGTAVKSEGVGK